MATNIPAPPERNEDPWFDKRDAFDQAVRTRLNTELSDAALNATIGEGVERAPVVKTFATIDALMATDLPTGTDVAISGFISYDDTMDVTYRIESGQRADRVLQRIAVPLNDGRWAVPYVDKLTLDGYDARMANEMIRVARTYVTAGADLVYDATRQGPLNAPSPVHTLYSKPYPVTCSVFANLVVMGMRYQDTTYVADANTRFYPWGSTYPTKEFIGPPLQSHRMLQYFVREGKVAYYREGKTEPKPGDLLFYCKQNPEGPGTGGVYFLNNYHVALYIGDGKVIHAYSALSGNGVVEQNLSETPTGDLCFIARGSGVHQVLDSQAALSSAIGIAGMAGNISHWYDNNLLVLVFDGITVGVDRGPGTYVSTFQLSPNLRPLTTFSGVIHATTGQIVRVRVNTDGSVSLTNFATIPTGAVLYGSVVTPIRMMG